MRKLLLIVGLMLASDIAAQAQCFPWFDPLTKQITCAPTVTTVARGTATLGTSAVSSATCATVVTVSATGVATTDVVTVGFRGDPTGITGYVPSTSGMLSIIPYPSANNVNFKVCNNTGSSITPGALTLNWAVRR